MFRLPDRFQLHDGTEARYGSCLWTQRFLQKQHVLFCVPIRRMLDQMANHASRIRRYMDRFGLETVETFLDACLSVENLIDQRALFEPRSIQPAVEEAPAEVADIKLDSN